MFRKYVVGIVVSIVALCGSTSAVCKEAAGEEGIRKKKITNSIGMEFVYIQPGSFLMGSPKSESGRIKDERQHRVTLTRGFYMGVTEVTQEQWQKVMGVNTATHKKCGGKCPMESITWQQVLSFIEKLNKKEEGTTYRLPTEAEWEYACRAGTRTTFSWGNVADCSKMNYENGTEGQEDSCSEYVGKKGLRPDSTVPVKTYPPNAWGLYDMHGNVWEWCQDWYGDYPSGSVTDPKGPAKGVYRVGRGGAFFRKAQYCRSATRYLFTPQYGYEGLGFRLVRNP